MRLTADVSDVPGSFMAIPTSDGYTTVVHEQRPNTGRDYPQGEVGLGAEPLWVPPEGHRPTRAQQADLPSASHR
jgi:hypothetical protein